VAAPSADRINARAAKDKKFLQRALKNPGLRAKLNPKYLSKPQQASRTLNARLNAPITPGSSTTERDLAHEAQAATTVRYGPQDRQLAQQLGVAQQTQVDTGNAYDQYRQALQQHATNVQLYQAGAQQALQQTAQGITGLGSAEAAQMQTQANQAAAQQGVAPAGDLSALANAAMATRQGVMGTFQGEQALTGAATNRYADTQANVVAPGQKLAAQAQAAGRTRDVRQKVTDLATEKGAYDQTFRDTRRQDEFKNVLAATSLNVNAAQNQATATNAQSRITETTRHNKTAEQIAKTRNRTAAKTAQQKADLQAGKVNQYGYTDAAWRAMSTSQRQKVIKDSKVSTANPATTDKKAFRDKYGVDLQPTAAHNRARDAVQNAETAFGQVGKVTQRKDGSKKRVTTDEVVQVLRGQGTSNVLIRAALDIERYGHITAGTANRMHQAGYSVKTLGYQTGPPVRRGGNRPRSGTSSAPAAGATTTSSQSR
jgi:hypothetical protein